MDLSINELLLQRLKYMEYSGNYSPTMNLIINSNLNPMFFKLRKVFTKKNQITPEPKHSKLYVRDYCRKSNFSVHENTLPSPSNHKKCYTKNLCNTSKLPNAPTFSNFAYEKLKKTEAFPRNRKLPQISIESIKYKVPSVDLSVVNSAEIKSLNTVINDTHTNSDPEKIICKSLDCSASRRQIIFSKQKKTSNQKDFSSFYDAIDHHISCDSSVSNL